ncbi:fumarylacetoacetate hydrolase family protein [Alicyclobacillus macrosporangiidus]|uniref:2-keto-4-pentenoate hydratase/2-oxohepta-3-ene-1,7-dioic acid hydratase (Catechol pathway) n=1 Tax=Alicyclobacillus macrosporangiidus TaxID=392015 RepID=A0A1I7L009_9BACL|nr:fumarylacetoacetate hydrolase family protein [Alicyclobacillus macrosporangiidus]SFV03027.1 2-keto-4-pentenoate hydratase/2-oxohepta-3-ene-1,7-dioic acid hydratase (catechol pathway) [Alicyclobacillus macrosporangiidus]
MGVRLVRFEKDGDWQWGVMVEERVKPLAARYPSLGQLLTEGIADVRRAAEAGEGRWPDEEVRWLCPVTRPARLLCQGANYANHRLEAGMAPVRPPYNLIFAKSDTSLSGPEDDIVRPANVRLLDYEVELALVIGRPLTEPTRVTADNLGDYVAGIVMCDDISARDVQLVEGQWFKGKSYRTFCPTGPFIYLFDEGESGVIHDLHLNLWVNGELRQSANTGQLLYRPEETLTELSAIVDLAPGDLVLTGTPGGVALHLTSEEMASLSDPRIPAEDKWALLERSQAGRAQYLKDGDVVTCEIHSSDGKVHLGTQRNQVVSLN